ncbi:M10 family metallopeptidase C-terminal domain-containing protein [Qipengyuania gelatinilytica]|uniref:M10 family metallopeptidase C-terminal domain-containing protein n=1 Tax=Qipengyuania gelatinilytica TaxID=2867231 RepID=A0ABX9A4J4_9SPHN|nr:M10 family metallopeptidase C-terminal domain-containing protein [Qipengyuania gelatinilytica]QZD96185.1 M10 family metallopeptidase C-terminal domain-containing protein [Qipengyuania gelatinilytica]
MTLQSIGGEGFLRLEPVSIRDFEFNASDFEVVVQHKCAGGCFHEVSPVSGNLDDGNGVTATFASGTSGPLFIDTPGDATTTINIAPGGSVTDTLEVAGDRDWFRIELTEGQTITITLEGSGIDPLADPYLRVRDADGNLVDFNDDSNGLNSALTFSASVAGTYYIEAGAYADAYAGEYTITVDTFEVAGDSSTTATIGKTDLVTGLIDDAGDHDWYAIELNEGDGIDIFLRAAGANPLSDPYVRVYDANGNLVAENDNDTGSLDSFLNFVASSGGTYYIDAGASDGTSTGTYELETVRTNFPVFDYDQIADQLTTGYWGSGPRAWDISDGIVTYNIDGLTAEGQYLAVQALNLWSDFTGIQFVEESNVNQAEMIFDDEQSGAYASTSRSGGTITSADINISTDWLNSYGTTLNSYSFQTYIHEIGHALGLGHAGGYNGSAGYPDDADYQNDSWATTVMSYFSQTENDYFFDQGFTYAYINSPMAGDYVAVLTLYGGASDTRTANTVYGFFNNSGRDIYDATQYPDAAYAIVDSGGIDVMNYRGFSADQVINLNEETFSSIGGEVGNVTIVRGTVIEWARGGSGIDTIYGNAADNVFWGYDGADVMFGDLGIDTAYGGLGDDVIEGGDGNDLLYGQADNDTLRGDAGDDDLRGGSNNDLIEGGEGNDVLYGNRGSDTIDGGADSDTIYGGEGIDFISGGDGDDFLYGETGRDYLYGGLGNDWLEGGSQNDDLYGEEGNDTLFGLNNDDSLVGGTGNDWLEGGDGDDQLRGGGDDDMLIGGNGNDTIWTHGGSDVVRFSEYGTIHFDNIVDFGGADAIHLDTSVFDIADGALDASVFVLGTDAQDADDRIIYDQSTGELWYDEDGSGAIQKKLIAVLDNNFGLQASDILGFGTSVPAEPIKPMLMDLASVDQMVV